MFNPGPSVRFSPALAGSESHFQGALGSLHGATLGGSQTLDLGLPSLFQMNALTTLAGPGWAPKLLFFFFIEEGCWEYRKSIRKIEYKSLTDKSRIYKFLILD